VLAWFKKNSVISDGGKSGVPKSPLPLEILLPEELVATGTPDLRIASKFLSLLVESKLPSQHLEAFDGLPVVNSQYQPIKQFITTVNGAKQLNSLIAQVKVMLFHSNVEGAMGSLCCLVNGVFTEFVISQRAQNAAVNWEITRHERPAT
jgi:hypothetical protein